ncbi:MAG TPA: efflux RND transporter periplasmic adaptor subunit [Methylocella sp.]|nr:efflux RND transporter periplasmic adaptor subunit [Methylocella sp.]
MMRFGWTSLALAASLAVGAGGYFAGRAGFETKGLAFSAAASTSSEAQQARSPQPFGKKTILYYRNPMGLPEISPVPKKDSMGMDFIPVFADEEDDGTTVRVSPGKIQRAGVKSETAAKHAISRLLRVPGTVELDERRISVVATRAEAFIDKVENVTTGDRVRKGQPLLHLYSPAVAAAAAQYLSNPGFDGSRRRLENLNVPADVIAAIERTHKVELSIPWASPRDGVVLERNAVEGMKAAAGEVLFRIADISVLWVFADVPEHEMAMAGPGAPAIVRIRSLPGLTFSGHVGLIYPQVNMATRTARMRIEIANPDGVVLPGMYADVEIAAGNQNPVLAVPESAVIDTGTRQLVILDKGEGRFEPKDVETGSHGGGLVEIRKGIEAGAKVVVAANFLIDAESNLKAALRGMTGADAAQ